MEITREIKMAPIENSVTVRRHGQRRNAIFARKTFIFVESMSFRQLLGFLTSEDSGAARFQGRSAECPPHLRPRTTRGLSKRVVSPSRARPECSAPLRFLAGEFGVGRRQVQVRTRSVCTCKRWEAGDITTPWNPLALISTIVVFPHFEI